MSRSTADPWGRGPRRPAIRQRCPGHAEAGAESRWAGRAMGPKHMWARPTPHTRGCTWSARSPMSTVPPGTGSWLDISSHICASAALGALQSFVTVRWGLVDPREPLAALAPVSLCLRQGVCSC